MTLEAGHIIYGPQFDSLDTGRQRFRLLQSWGPFRLALLFCLENVGYLWLHRQFPLPSDTQGGVYEVYFLQLAEQVQRNPVR